MLSVVFSRLFERGWRAYGSDDHGCRGSVSFCESEETGRKGGEKNEFDGESR